MRAIEVKCKIIGAAFDQAQFDLLMKCSAKHDMTEWDEWKKHISKQPVLLQNANLANAYLRGIDLRVVDLSGAKPPAFSLRWVDLSGAGFRGADIWSFLYKAIVTSVDLSLPNKRLADFTRIGATFTPKSGLPARRVLALSHDSKLSPVALRQEIAEVETCPELKVAVG